MTPGQAQLAHRELQLADRALLVARLAHDAGALEDAASRLYYAAFHAARAALVVQGLTAKTHTGLVRLFGQTYGVHPALSRLFQMRVEADYGTEPFTRTGDDLEAALADAAALVERCRRIVDQATAEEPNQPDPPPDR